MSSLTVQRGDGILDEARLAKEEKQLLTEAREDRKRFEPTWQSNLAFAAGKFYLAWDRDTRRLVMPPELQGKDLYAPDVITEYRMTALGELGSDDSRPELLLRHDDKAAEEYQKALNRALAYGWDMEWRGDEKLEEVRRLTLDLGTAALQCEWDANVGPVAGEIPHVGGQPRYDTAELFGDTAFNEQVEMRPVRQGRICWRPRSAFNILVPPGVPNEDDFPWECIVDTVQLSDAKAEYGDVVVGLKEDTDIGSLLGLDTASETADSRSLGLGIGGQSDGKAGRVRGQVWRYRYYERPSGEWPNGRVLTFLGGKMRLARHEDRLPYQTPDGTYASGIVYFHWQRVSGRFFSRSLVEPMKDIQRAVWKRRTQTVEIIDRGMPFVLVDEKQPQLANRKGTPVEVVPIKGQQSGAPQIFQGVGPGDWMYKDIEALRSDLEHATGLRGPRLGENPMNVTTYAQLALINENEQVKREPIFRQHQKAIARAVEFSVFDMRTYWGPERMVQLAGDENKVEAEIFNATKIPPFFIVEIAKGSAKPRTQAANLKLVEDVAQYALNSRQPVPVRWMLESLTAGQPLELPEQPGDVHIDKALLENHSLLEGEQPPVAYYDEPNVHVPIHREAQIQAEQSGDTMAVLRIEKHIQDHLAAAAQNAAQLAQIQAPANVGLQAAQAQIDQGQQSAQSAQEHAQTMQQQAAQAQFRQAGQQGASSGGSGSGRSTGSSAVAGIGAGSQPQQTHLTVPMHVNVPPANLSVEAPQVHVASPSVEPHVTVNVPKVEVQEQQVEFHRDEMGRITGASVKKKQRKRAA